MPYFIIRRSSQAKNFAWSDSKNSFLEAMTSPKHEPPLPAPALHRRLPNPASDHTPALHRGSSLSQHRWVPPVQNGANDNALRRSTLPFLSISALPSPNHRGDVAVRSMSKTERTSSISSVRGPAGDMEHRRGPLDVDRDASYSRDHVCLCPPDPKIPRPRNSFILFRQHQQSTIIAQNPGIPNPEVSKIIGEQWRQLPTEAKEEWNMLAEAEKARHQEQYPGYRYHPRRSGRASNQSSVSGPSSTDSQDPCAKCGGKPIQHLTYNPPAAPNSTQQTMAAQVPAKRGYVVSGPPGQRVYGQPTVSPEQLGQQKSFVEAYPFSRVDPRLIYAVPPTAHRPPPSDPQDAKRRRYNSNGVYVSSGQPYPDPAYAYPGSPLNNPYTRGEPMQQVHASQIPIQRIHGIQPTKPAVISPPRAVYPHPPQLQPVRPPHPHQRARSTVALPPIETVLAQTPIKTQSTSSQSSGVEAMIMSIPVLNKIKVLSQISGPLPNPGLLSPKPDVRGAIIAIEGMDISSVTSMTNSLAEQLGKGGNFAVRVFNGPDPYALLRDTKNGISSRNGKFTTELYLKMLSEWHKTSDEMVEYISTRPRAQKLARSASIHMDGSLIDPPATPGKPEHDQNMLVKPTSEVPQSAISPKTIHKAAELSIVSPPSMTERRQSTRISPQNPQDDVEMTIDYDTEKNSSRLAPLQFPRPVNSSRIPPIPTPPPLQQPITRALSKASSKRVLSLSQSQPDSSQPLPHGVEFMTDDSSQPKGAAIDQELDQDSLLRTCTDASSAIPIALVPHFQLTTVDASSISMPISDGFSPPAHWQWFATLWRGSVGPDVTIVIKSTEDDTSEHSLVGPGTGGDTSVSKAANLASATTSNTASINNASTATSQQSNSVRDRSSGSVAGSSTTISSTSSSGVEIRLHDCRAVVVKTGIVSSSSTAIGNVASEDGAITKPVVSAKELEYWEKAKRRVGFEVEEFLRR